MNTSGGAFPGSSVFEIAANGVDLNKLVIGKPGAAADATNGFIDPATLGTCVDQAKAKGWSAGVMAFQVCWRTCLMSSVEVMLTSDLLSQFPNADATWIKSAKGTSFQ